MTQKNAEINLNDGDFCKVITGTHKDKSGYIQDIKKVKRDTLQLQFLRKTELDLKHLGKM